MVVSNSTTVRRTWFRCLKCAIVCFALLPKSLGDSFEFVLDDIEVVEGSTTEVTIRRHSTNFGETKRVWWSIHLIGKHFYPHTEFLKHSGSILFDRNQQTAVLSVTVLDDDYAEKNEKAFIAVGEASREDTESHDRLIITILANDHPYGLFYIPERYRLLYLNEHSDNRRQISVERKKGQFGSVTVFYRTVYRATDRLVKELPNIDRADEDDFVPAVGTVQFENGETSKVIHIVIKNDTVNEPNEYFEVRIQSCEAMSWENDIGDLPVIYDQQQSHSTVVIVQDEHPCGLFSLWPPDITLTENSSATTVTVLRSSGYLGNVTVRIAVMTASGNISLIKDRINVTFSKFQREIDVHIGLHTDFRDDISESCISISIDNLIVELEGTNLNNASESWAEIGQNSSCMVNVSKPPTIPILTEVAINKSDLKTTSKRVRVVENNDVAWLLPLGVIVGGLTTTLFIVLISKYMHVPIATPENDDEYSFEHNLIKDAINDLINNGELFTVEKLLNMYEEFCNENENGKDIKTDFVLIREAREKIGRLKRNAAENAAEKETMELFKNAIARNDTSAVDDILTKHELFLIKQNWDTPKESLSDDVIVQQKHDRLKELLDEALQNAKCPVVEKALNDYCQFVEAHKERVIADQDLITRANDCIRKSQLHAYHERLKHKLRGVIRKLDIAKVQEFLDDYQVLVCENEPEIVSDKELIDEASALLFPPNVQVVSDEERVFNIPEPVPEENSIELPSEPAETLPEDKMQEEVGQQTLETSDAVVVEQSVSQEAPVEENTLILEASDAVVEELSASNEAPSEEKMLIETALNAYLLFQESTCISEDCDAFVKILLELSQDNHTVQNVITRLTTEGITVAFPKMEEVLNLLVKTKYFVSGKQDLFKSKSDILNTIDRASDFAKILHGHESLRCDLMKAVDAKVYIDLQAIVADYSDYISVNKLDNVADKQCLVAATQLIELLENETRRQNLLEECSELKQKLEKAILNGKADLKKTHTDKIDAVTDDKNSIEGALQEYLQFIAEHEIASDDEVVSEANDTLYELGQLIENMGIAINLKEGLSNVLSSCQEAVISSALQKYVEFVQSCKNKIVADGKLVTKAEGAIRIIHLKDKLHEAWLSRDIKTLNIAIEEAEQSLLEAKLEPELGIARRLRDNLIRIDQLKSAILNLSRATMMEIRDYRDPPKVVHDVMVAVLLILGDAETETRDWATCQKLCCSVRTPTYPGLLKRVHEYNFKDLEPEIAARGEKILESFTEDDVHGVSHGAFVFYIWALNMCKQCLALVEYAPRPASRSRQHTLLCHKTRPSTGRRGSEPKSVPHPQ